MIAVFVVLTIVGFLLLDWIVQLVAARKDRTIEQEKAVNESRHP